MVLCLDLPDVLVLLKVLLVDLEVTVLELLDSEDYSPMVIDLEFQRRLVILCDVDHVD